MPGDDVPTAAILSPTPIALQRLDGLRAGIDGGADLAERRRRLEDLRLNPEGLQRIRGREPGEPAADDRDPAA